MNVAIVIVSHSSKIAEGTAEMVRQIVGNTVPLAFTGGNADNGLGTDLPLILAAIRSVRSPSGVVILVDIGSAESNSEVAIEMLEHEKRGEIVICNAPIVEGALMAATTSSSGSSVDAVRRAAESIYRR